MITDAEGAIVGAFWPGDGLVEFDAEGVPKCVVYTELLLPESPFYRLTVNGQHEIVTSAEPVTLGEITIAWPDAPATPVAARVDRYVSQVPAGRFAAGAGLPLAPEPGRMERMFALAQERRHAG